MVLTTSNEGGTTSTVAVSMSSPGGLNAMGVRMVYQSSDVKAAKATSASSATTTATGTRSSAGATSSSGAEGGSSGGLSTGATVAIAVVVVVLAIAAVVGAFFWMRKRKQRQQYGAVRPASPAPAPDTEPKLGSGYYDPKSTQELSGIGVRGNRDQSQELVELGQENRPSEMPQHYVDPVELPAGDGWRR